MSARWWIALFFAVGTARAETVKNVFKFDSVVSAESATLKRFTFGLKPGQVNAILQLTQGEINFGNVYYRESAADDFAVLNSHPGYSGTIYPNVPPPVIIQDFAGDPALIGQYWIDQLNVKPAWQKATGAGVVIADCDAGYFHDESDLQANMLLDHKFDLSNTDESGVVNDGPFAYHGTAVSAILGGVQDALGTNGIAYDAKLVPLQNFNYDVNKDKLDKEEATAACILRAIATPGVSVVVLENQTANGSSETFIGTRDAVRLALRSNITVVGAAGNFNMELIEEKNDDTGSIIVGALMQNGDAAAWTNYGERNTVGAYGEWLWTLHYAGGGFGDFGGTSGATPQVAAAVALMKEINPLLTPERMRELLVQTREVIPGNAKAGGRLNVLSAVDAALAARVTLSELTAWTEKEQFRAQLAAILTR